MMGKSSYIILLLFIYVMCDLKVFFLVRLCKIYFFICLLFIMYVKSLYRQNWEVDKNVWFCGLAF